MGLPVFYKNKEGKWRVFPQHLFDYKDGKYYLKGVDLNNTPSEVIELWEVFWQDRLLFSTSRDAYIWKEED